MLRFNRHANFTVGSKTAKRNNSENYLRRLQNGDQYFLKIKKNEDVDDILTEVYLKEILSNVRQILEEIIFGRNWEKEIFGNSENKTNSLMARSNKPTQRKV